MKHLKPLLFKTVYMVVSISLAITIAITSAYADVYPDRPIRLIVPFAPGGATDLQGRVIAPLLANRLGQQVIVDNRAGGGSVIGTEILAKADPDGYSLILVDAAFTSQPAVQRLPYDPINSFAPIALVSNATSVLVVHPSVPANSVKEFIALAKQKPGKLIIATSGMGGGGHIALSLFQMMANIELNLVHFKGGGPAMIDVLGGHSNGILGALSTSLPHIKSGKLRALATCGLERSLSLPEVPTIAEDALPGFEYNSYRAVLAPANTPASIIDKLSNVLKEILSMEEVKTEFRRSGAEVFYQNPTECRRILEKEINLWSETAIKAKIKMD